MIDQYKYI